MSELKDLFHKPQATDIGGTTFMPYKLAFEQFDDALLVGGWMLQLDMTGQSFDMAHLDALKADAPERQAIHRLIAGSLKAVVPEQPVPVPLQVADVAAMPCVMAAEALTVLLELNADFFLQAAPKMVAAAARIRSIGSALPSS